MVYNDTSQQLLKAQSKEATVKSINGLVDVILETCSSDDIEITIAGCRNLRALLVSGSCSHGLFRSGNPSIVLRILCQRLTVATYDTAKPSSDQSDGSTEYWMHGGDVILALLSAIYDVVHQFKVFGDRVVANAERDLMRDVMTLCFNVVQLPDQTKARRTSAMRCALIASNMHFLCTFDSQVAISMETLGEVSTFLTTDDTGNTHEQKIWIELLQRRQQELYYSQGKIVLLNAVEIHERAAQETENIKRFVVEEVNKSHSFWQRDSLPVELFNPYVIYQKLDYIHNNPVEEGIVFRPEDYKYSSAPDYAGEKGLLDGVCVFQNFKL